jgi:DNA-binding transcriptional regulator YiaG
MMKGNKAQISTWNSAVPQSAWAYMMNAIELITPFDRSIYMTKKLSPRDIRKQLGMNQHDFWSQIGVTQSGGSRYESGRNMPKPVAELLRVVHIEGIDLSSLRKQEIKALELLRTESPELLTELIKKVEQAEAISA